MTGTAARARRVTTRVGRRGAVLLILGVIDFIYGWVRLLHAGPDAQQQLHTVAAMVPAVGFHTAVIVWGLGWWATGAACVINAFRHGDKWGFGAALGLKVAWVAANTVAWVQGVPNAAPAVAVWALTAGLVAVVAGWPEPPDLPGGVR